jgi:hypothetical protein
MGARSTRSAPEEGAYSAVLPSGVEAHGVDVSVRGATGSPARVEAAEASILAEQLQRAVVRLRRGGRDDGARTACRSSKTAREWYG